MNQFITDSEEVVANASGEANTLRSLKPLLQLLLQAEISERVFIPRDDKYAMNLIHMPKDQSFSVIGAVWQPKQTTPIHDHLTWALVGVYEGEEEETLYRRIDDGADPKIARLERVSQRVNRKGDISVLSSAGIHRVDNPKNIPARSIHVYGRDIGSTERHTYDPVTGKIGTFVSGYCNVLRDLDRF
jgi:predicted metal-dependent enzyme (double-stranded beta helix superfamily)